MVLKCALCFALVVFVIQNIFGREYEASVMTSVFYFVIAFIIGLVVDILYSHIRVKLALIAEEERLQREGEKERMRFATEAKSNAITQLFGADDEPPQT